MVSDQLTDVVIQAIIKVHQQLGPGFQESIYRNALVIDLAARGVVTELEKEIVIYYEGHVIGRHRLDLLVHGELILELKAVEQLAGFITHKPDRI
jgi:GxxExxY protein